MACKPGGRISHREEFFTTDQTEFTDRNGRLARTSTAIRAIRGIVAAMSLPVGVTLPNYGPLAGAESLARLARHAEGLGFDSVCVADHLVAPCDATSIYPFDRRAQPGPARLDGLVDLYEPLLTLAYVAALTQRVRLGVSVYVVPYRNPVVTAKLVATLDALSGGRVTFGVGVGWLREEFRAVGADPTRRGRVTDEYLEVCRRLWRDDVASFAGAYYDLPPVRSGPKPVQRPWPPIWVGGNSAAALTRAVALGDGLHLIDLSPEEIAPIGAQFAARLHAAQRERSTLTLSLRSSVTVGDRRTPDGVDRLRDNRDAYARAGVDYLVVGPRQAASVDQLQEAHASIAAALIA
jgi:probable F420-dependent oxidoreductase